LEKKAEQERRYHTGEGCSQEIFKLVKKKFTHKGFFDRFTKKAWSLRRTRAGVSGEAINQIPDV
jgi:hypothetical protein